MTNTHLVVHIGSGKTGSSSIQMTLRNNEPALAAAGTKYLGLMLEHCTNQNRPEWQMHGGSPRFFEQTPAEVCNDKVLAILKDEIDRLSQEGISTAIWSNEWMYGRHGRVIEALTKLRDSGVKITLICYLRRHDKWAQSAYMQWALKSKNYQGPIRSFAQWYPGQALALYPVIEPWLERFGADLKLFNFDEVGDVVAHFSKVNGLPEMAVENENISPDADLLAAWATYNNRFSDTVQMSRFQHITGPMVNTDQLHVKLPPLEELLPTPEDLNQIVEKHRPDIEAINAVFEAQGQPPLNFDKPPRTLAPPSSWDMDQLMLKMIFALQEQVFHLRHKLQAMEKAAAEPTDAPQASKK